MDQPLGIYSVASLAGLGSTKLRNAIQYGHPGSMTVEIAHRKEFVNTPCCAELGVGAVLPDLLARARPEFPV